MNVVRHDLVGCQVHECGAYIDTFWGSSLPNGLYGLCTSINFHLTLQLITFYSFLKLILILMGIMIAETRWHECWYQSFMCSNGWQVSLRENLQHLISQNKGTPPYSQDLNIH